MRRIGYLLLMCCGLCSLWLGTQGLLQGEVFLLAKRGQRTVSALGDPAYYWISVAVWLAGGVLLLVLGWRRLRRASAQS
jgi:hypothetical protein